MRSPTAGGYAIALPKLGNLLVKFKLNMILCVLTKSFIHMPNSIFKHLVDSVNKDYDDTYAYVGKNFEFIRKLINKIALHIEFTPAKDIYILDEKGSKIGQYDFIQDAIIVENHCLFSLKLLIYTQNKGFNLNSCGRSFFDKGLATTYNRPLAKKFCGMISSFIKNPYQNLYIELLLPHWHV